MCMKPMKRSQKKEILAMADSRIDDVVKIQGTKFDRKRKLSDSTINKMNRMYNKGMTISEIAHKLDLNYMAVKYNVDPAFRFAYNERRSGAHYGNTYITQRDRIAYKKELVNKRKIKVK